MATTNVTITQDWGVVSTTSTLLQFSYLDTSMVVELATGTTVPDANFSGMRINSGQTASYTLDGETLYGRVRPPFGITSVTLILEPLA